MVVEEKVGSKEAERSVLWEEFDYRRGSNVLVVKLNRLIRSLRELSNLIG